MTPAPTRSSASALAQLLYSKTRNTKILTADPIPENFPAFYLLPVSCGRYSLFAFEGKHRGAGMGVFNPASGTLLLYGSFLKRGGLAWQDWKDHLRFKVRKPKQTGVRA